MGMPITIEIVNCHDKKLFLKIFDFFRQIDKKFSPYKPNSEVTLINKKRLTVNQASLEMRKILKLASQTHQQTHGYFDIYKNGQLDPSGIVKGWAILEAAKLLKKSGQRNFYIEAGGDIQLSGKNRRGEKWKVGIKNPFSQTEIVKVLNLNTEGVATSGIYERGEHIYNPKDQVITGDIVSLTVVSHNIYEADRFATAAFAMGEAGISFINSQKGLEAYAIRKNGRAIFTQNFDKYLN
jgi:thiamine biosynthesis lipoprotein